MENLLALLPRPSICKVSFFLSLGLRLFSLSLVLSIRNLMGPVILGVCVCVLPAWSLWASLVIGFQWAWNSWRFNYWEFFPVSVSLLLFRVQCACILLHDTVPLRSQLFSKSFFPLSSSFWISFIAVTLGPLSVLPKGLTCHESDSAQCVTSYTVFVISRRFIWAFSFFFKHFATCSCFPLHSWVSGIYLRYLLVPTSVSFWGLFVLFFSPGCRGHFYITLAIFCEMPEIVKFVVDCWILVREVIWDEFDPC